MAPADEIAKFRGMYKIGWDKLREQRHAKQIELGIMDKAWALSPRPPEVKAWDDLTPKEQDRFDHIMAIYAAVIAHMDKAVGRLVETLKQRGQLDNTLILFMSDNGANAESGPNGRLEGRNPGATKTTVFEGQSWATLSNTPLRRYKHFNHEGGISTPLIAHWPAQIKTPGELRYQPGHLIDVMATCVEVAGAKYPAEFKGQQIRPMEGRSLIQRSQTSPLSATQFIGSMKVTPRSAPAIGNLCALALMGLGSFTISRPIAPNCTISPMKSLTLRAIWPPNGTLGLSVRM